MHSIKPIFNKSYQKQFSTNLFWNCQANMEVVHVPLGRRQAIGDRRCGTMWDVVGRYGDVLGTLWERSGAPGGTHEVARRPPTRFQAVQALGNTNINEYMKIIIFDFFLFFICSHSEYSYINFSITRKETYCELLYITHFYVFIQLGILVFLIELFNIT